MDSLDSYLIARIAFYLPSPLDAPLRAVSSRFRAILNPPVKRSPHDLMVHGAKIGCRELCILAHTLSVDAGKEINYWVAQYAAALHNHRAICDLLCEWYEPRSSILDGACKGGHRELCELTHNWMRANHWDIEYDRLLDEAACGGHRAICDLIIAWVIAIGDVPSYTYLLGGAAEGGHRGLCEYARSKGVFSRAHTYDWMFYRAIHGNQLAICELVHSWVLTDGAALDYSEHFETAAETENREICELMHSWCLAEGKNAVIYNGIFSNAAYNNNLALCELARTWIQDSGQTGHYMKMLEGAADGGRLDLCIIARQWMQENGQHIPHEWLEMMTKKNNRNGIASLAREWLLASIRRSSSCCRE